jgi:hypothetical protein
MAVPVEAEGTDGKPPRDGGKPLRPKKSLNHHLFITLRVSRRRRASRSLFPPIKGGFA